MNATVENRIEFAYNMVKGRIAETIVQEMFLTLGYNVFPYGMENTVPGIMHLLKGVKSTVATDIRRMPDFVVQQPETGQLFFIEVKFRADGCFTFKNLKEGYPYENAYIVLVSKKHIKCLSYSQLKAGDVITETSKNYIAYHPDLKLDRDIVKQFCDFALLYFASV